MRCRETHQERIQRAHRNKGVCTFYIAKELEAFFDNTFERHLLFIRLQANRREKSDKIFAQQPFQILDPVFCAFVVLRHHQNRARLFQESRSDHHRCGRNRGPIHMKRAPLSLAEEVKRFRTSKCYEFGKGFYHACKDRNLLFLYAAHGNLSHPGILPLSGSATHQH